jgi:hypothetical protein
VPAAALPLAAQITVFCRVASIAESRMTRLWNELIDDAVKVLLDKHVVVAVEDHAHSVIDEHLMNWFAPTWAVAIKLVTTRCGPAPPFPEASRLGASTLAGHASTNEVMEEDESKLCIALLQGSL